jgi:lipopolysaccharide export LptBFGC system permease protein LptF
MKKYQRYIAITYFASFLRTLLFLSAIIISIKTLNIAQRLTRESSVDLQNLITISFHIIPYVLFTLTPFASTVAAANVFNSFLSTSQITVLQNAKLTNLKIATTHMMITVPIAILMLYASSFILPKTSEIREEVQDSIIKEKIQNFFVPDSIKTFGNLTIITSPKDILKHIPLTLIHQKTKDGEFVFVGNIQETWSNNKMVGINANNATILTINENSETLIKFQTLETQIDFFTESEKSTDSDYLTTPDLIKEYKKDPNNKLLKEINKRFMPSFVTILLPFALITLLIKFHNNRTNFNIKNITIITIALLYILFSCYHLVDILNTPKTFGVVYINILLTFIFVCILNKQNLFTKRYAVV